MREIVLDTETTGLDPTKGDRLVEIGCVEIFNRMHTGQTFHRHLSPEREMPAEAFAVHGLSTGFLAAKPLFAHVVEEFLEFIADAPLVMIECPRLLFPFAREIIATAVRDGGFPPLMLDPVDFVGLYRQNVERQAAAQAAQAKPS